MRLLEIVRGSKTADDVLVTSIKMAQKIGKVPVVSENQWGFIGNRVLEPYGREAGRLLLEGASPAQIDNVLYEFGFAMGLLSVMDLAGIDVGYLTRQARKKELSVDPTYAAVANRLYELGRYGQKTKRGTYIYKGRDKIDDPEVVEIAKNLAEGFGIEQRNITDKEVLERCVYMLINEGAKVLGEGVSYRSSDIDTVYTNGYGFPGHRGGPMQFADEVGLDKILTAIESYRDSLGDYGKLWFEPAPVLQELVAAGKKFRDYVPPAFNK
jgi:3-hydroxyacyl-CoA dehydrogenase